MNFSIEIELERKNCRSLAFSVFYSKIFYQDDYKNQPINCPTNRKTKKNWIYIIFPFSLCVSEKEKEHVARYGDFAERFSITFHLSEVCGVGMSKKFPILFDLKNLSMCTSAGAPQSFTSKSVFFFFRLLSN